MSIYDYEVSQKISQSNPPYYALIMAAMRKADSDNTLLLRIAYPELWNEMQKRYNAPGGVIEGDPGKPRPAVSVITPTIARHVLHYFGEIDGWTPGSFSQKLMELIIRADTENKSKLKDSFPGYVEAIRISQEEMDGTAELKEIAAHEGKL